MGILDRIKRVVILIENTIPTSDNPRGGKFEVFGGPLDGKFIDYTGERFRADEKGPVALAFVDYEYVIRCDDYSNRLYYTWTRRSGLNG